VSSWRRTRTLDPDLQVRFEEPMELHGIVRVAGRQEQPPDPHLARDGLPLPVQMAKPWLARP
jgi:hypothetical protein